MSNFRVEFHDFLHDRRTRLAATYLAIIVVLTGIFSVVLYTTSAVHFERFAPPPLEPMSSRQDFLSRDTFRMRRDEVRDALIVDLVWLNIGVAILGAVFSYYLAGRTLEPIEEAMQMQSQFISDASHEIRTPLATLQTSNEVALKTAKKLSGEMRELLESNVAQVERLRQLTDGLLGLIKAENSKPIKTSVSLPGVISEVIESVDQAATKKSIAVVQEVDDAIVITDQQALIRILRIFCDNAIKYSPQQTTVRIATERKGDHILVKVEDQGIGISEEDIDKIFTRFYRVDESRSAQHVEGYGIGLSIAKTLCERLDVPLTVKSTPGQGSTFMVMLPLD